MKAFYHTFTILIVVCFVNCGHENFEYTNHDCILRDISSTSELLEILKNLTELKTKKKMHDSEHDKVENLDYFVKISFQNVPLKTIPSKLFEKFHELQTLIASNVSLEFIDHDDFKFAQKLQVLNLSNNKISLIDEKFFGNLKALTRLDLGFWFLFR